METEPSFHLTVGIAIYLMRNPLHGVAPRAAADSIPYSGKFSLVQIFVYLAKKPTE